jgi:hypothetical protein
VIDLAIGQTKASVTETKMSTSSTLGDNPLQLADLLEASYSDEAFGKTLLVLKKGVIIEGDQEHEDLT